MKQAIIISMLLVAMFKSIDGKLGYVIWQQRCVITALRSRSTTVAALFQELVAVTLVETPTQPYHLLAVEISISQQLPALPELILAPTTCFSMLIYATVTGQIKSPVLIVAMETFVKWNENQYMI